MDMNSQATEGTPTGETGGASASPVDPQTPEIVAAMEALLAGIDELAASVIPANMLCYLPRGRARTAIADFMSSMEAKATGPSTDDLMAVASAAIRLLEVIDKKFFDSDLMERLGCGDELVDLVDCLTLAGLMDPEESPELVDFEIPSHGEAGALEQGEPA